MAAACEIAWLPEELISTVLSLTMPLDACRAAAVSRDFRAAADSDAAWSRFVLRDLPSLADGKLRDPAPTAASTKGQFLRLSDRPLLLADGLMAQHVARQGDWCQVLHALSARKLNIAWGATPLYWRWIPITGSSFPEIAELQCLLVGNTWQDR